MPGSGWFTGVLWGPIIQGIYNANPALEGLVTFDSWRKVVFLPMEVVTVVLAIGGFFVLKPAGKLPADAIEQLKAEKMPPATREEKATGCILVAVFVLFVTNRFHGIPDAAICMLSVVFFYIFGVMDSKDFSSGISWDLIVFIGMALSLSGIFAAAGISQWLSDIIVPALAPLAANPWLFMAAVLLLVFLWRFIDIALAIPTMAILTPILPAVEAAYHISPLAWVLIYVMAGNFFILGYQNMWALMAGSMARDRVWTTGHLAKYGLVYVAACLIAMLIAVPIYSGMGMF
jgi:hypothetical protein